MLCGEMQQFFKDPLKHALANDLLIFNTIQSLLSIVYTTTVYTTIFLLSPTVEYHLLAVCGTEYTTNSPISVTSVQSHLNCS